MNASEIIMAITIHLLVPAAGMAVYLLLSRRLLAAGASLLFLAQLLLLFVCYGGLLLVVLTVSFWEWSGMASAGFFFLLLGAPVLLLPVSISLSKARTSYAHRMAFRACIAYYLLIAALVCGISVMQSG
jgi:hypothetical protein